MFHKKTDFLHPYIDPLTFDFLYKLLLYIRYINFCEIKLIKFKPFLELIIYQKICFWKDIKIWYITLIKSF